MQRNLRVCQYCDRLFTTRYDRHMHEQWCLHQVRPCPYCNQRVTNNARRLHLQDHLHRMQPAFDQVEVANVVEKANEDNVDDEVQIVGVQTIQQIVNQRVEMARRNGEIIEIE